MATQTYTVKAGDNYNPFTGAKLTTSQKTVGTVISAPSSSSSSSSSSKSSSSSSTSTKTTTPTTTPTTTMTSYTVKAGDLYNPFTGAALTSSQKVAGTILTNPSSTPTTSTPTTTTPTTTKTTTPTTTTPTTTKTSTPTSSYTGTSIVDYLGSTGQDSSFSTRLKLAQENGIANYTGTAQQNTELLSKLRQKEIQTIQSVQTPTTPQITPTTPNIGQETPSTSIVQAPAYIGPTLQQGSTGADVSKVQSMLSSYGLTVDGQFGPKTLAAVKAFQASKGLVADGIVGPKTWQALSGTTTSPISPIIEGIITPTEGQIDEVTGEPIEQPLISTGNPTLDALLQTLQGTSPQTTWSQVLKQVYTDMGYDQINNEYEAYNKEYSKLQDKKNDEIQDINNNPWYTEGERQKRLQQLDKRYEGKELILQNKMKLAESQIDNIRSDAQYITGQTMAQVNENLKLQQDVILKAIEIAESQIAAESKLPSGIMGEYEYAVSQGYTGTFSQYQNEDANRKAVVAKAGAATTTIMPTGVDTTLKSTGETFGTVNTIGNILSDPNFDQAFGPKALITTMVPGTPQYTIAAQIQQIKDQISLTAREKLKGQGQISNYEGLMLANAQTALRIGMNPTDARQELINVKGILTTAAGGETKVLVSDGKGGTQVVLANGQTITEMRADGLSVNYIE